MLIYGAYGWAGYPGLMLWLCFFTSALLIAGYALCSLYSGNAKVGWAGALVIWLFASVGYAIRPQMIGYLLLILELLVIHLGRTRNPSLVFLAAAHLRPLGKLPRVLLPWHGSRRIDIRLLFLQFPGRAT